MVPISPDPVSAGIGILMTLASILAMLAALLVGWIKNVVAECKHLLLKNEWKGKRDALSITASHVEDALVKHVRPSVIAICEAARLSGEDDAFQPIAREYDQLAIELTAMRLHLEKLDSLVAEATFEHPGPLNEAIEQIDGSFQCDQATWSESVFVGSPEGRVGMVHVFQPWGSDNDPWNRLVLLSRRVDQIAVELRDSLDND